MTNFTCPVCGEYLDKNDRTYFCINGHCYDIARANYVNLLMSQASGSKRHGDDRTMTAARKNFLEKGYYNILLEGIISSIAKIIKNNDVIADLGCGEGWYTDNIFRWAETKGYDIKMLGIDISKEAVAAAAKRNRNISLAVASTASVPIGSESCDICLSVFAPYNIDEIRRILKKNGHFIKAYPLEDHLLSLKKIIYDNVYLNRVKNDIPNGFELCGNSRITGRLHLDSSADIMDLFMMTPYYYKTGRKDQEKIKNISALDTEIGFGICVFKKI